MTTVDDRLVPEAMSDELPDVPVDVDDEEGDLPGAVAAHISYGQMAQNVGGDMVQINYSVRHQMRRFHEYHDLGTAYVEQVMATFVERTYRTVGDQDLDSEAAAALFDADPCIVLTGQPETGRHTAAVALLAHLSRRRGIRLREATGWSAIQAGPLTEDVEPNERYGFLLEIPDHEEPLNFDHMLSVYREEMLAHSSYLVIVSSRDARRSLGPRQAGCVLDVGRPAHLPLLWEETRRLGPDGRLDYLIKEPAIASLIATASPGEVSRLARLMADTVDRDVPDVVASVIAAYKNWDAELADWFKNHNSVRERLFLVAASVLEGSSASFVLSGADHLGTFLGEPGHGRDGLGEAGIRELARETGASIDEDGWLTFSRPAYGPAVLDFLRRDRSQGFLSRLWDWTSRLPLDLCQPGPSAARLADVVANVTLEAVRRNRDASHLRTSAARWARRGDLRPSLIALLEAAALSPEAGRSVREQLNRWAASSNNEGLLCAIADVCAGPLADAYPTAALVRLRHLADRPVPVVADSVVRAVDRLWTRPQLRHAVLRQLLRWTVGDSDAAFTVACRLLVLLSDTSIPTDSLLFTVARTSWARDQLVDAVTRIVDSESSVGAEAVRSWMAQGAKNATIAGYVTALLVDAVGTSAPAVRISRLCHIAYGWCPVEGQDEAGDERVMRDRVVAALYRSDPMVGPRPTPTVEV